MTLRVLAEEIRDLIESAVVDEIARQMGGVSRIRAMIGATLISSQGDDTLVIKFPNRQRSKGNYVEVQYRKGPDAYDMRFYNSTAQMHKKVKEFKGVYAEDLVRLFTQQTGLRLRLF